MLRMSRKMSCKDFGDSNIMFLVNHIKNNKGITLISLVMTIILLIILAGIAINLSLGNNGLFNKTKEAKELTNKQEATEKINLKITTA